MNGYDGLRFSFAETELEIEAMIGLARKFLDHDSPERLKQWKRQLVAFRTSGAQESIHWEIPRARAIRTKLSNGRYEAGGQGISVVGVLSGTWEIKRLAKKSQFLLDGLASVSIQILDGGDEAKPVASWNNDVGDATSPGCHFHSQNNLSSAFPVPRHPIFLVTPLDTLDFLLGELFQNEWPKHVATFQRSRQWTESQRKRLAAVSRWQLAQFESGTGSWTVFKLTKPPTDLFVQ